MRRLVHGFIDNFLRVWWWMAMLWLAKRLVIASLALLLAGQGLAETAHPAKVAVSGKNAHATKPPPHAKKQTKKQTPVTKNVHNKKAEQAKNTRKKASQKKSPREKTQKQAGKSAKPGLAENNKSVTKTPVAAVKSFDFRGEKYYHRWTKSNQNEFTPNGQTDLQHWKEMITLILYPDVHDDKQLKMLADNIIVRYQKYGKVIDYLNNTKKSDDKAEYLIVAALGGNKLFETVVTSIRLDQGQAVGVIYSHRAYGMPAVQAEIDDWLPNNVPDIMKAIINWKNPSPEAIKALPQNME